MPDLSALKVHARPRAPKIPGATDAQREQGRSLAMIHAMHLSDMAMIRQMVERIEHDRSAAKDLAEAVPELAMTRNLRNFGALCGRECNNLLFHHGAEEHHMFPALEELGDTGLRAVIAKLREEHEVIHALLEDLGTGAMAVMQSPDPSTYAALRDTFEMLDAAIRSHFGYEETELQEALGVFQVL
ncbi:hemerythrin domain-containing protein [Amaricoccus tamworthensis]|uniref:hemerythrin domain-containing protein n=1 Tax=Amaricoccus tamworthensis TaxID=57002 RepID=UPI003C7DE0F5